MTFKRAGSLLGLIVASTLAREAVALQIVWTASTNFYVDFSTSPLPMNCGYVSCMVTNTDGITYSNLWVTAGPFTNTVMSLAAGDPGQYATGALGNNQGKPAFFYLQATNNPGNTPYSDQFSIKVYNGFPATGTLLTSSNFVLTVTTSGQNQANKVNSVAYSPTNHPVLGGLTKIAVQGSTGNVSPGNDMAFTAGVLSNWNAAAWELVACNITITDAVTIVLSNVLDTVSTIHITGTGDPYEADYWVRAISITQASTPISPVTYVNNGGGTVNHVQETTLASLPPIISSTNMITLGPIAPFAQLYTNEILSFGLRFTNPSPVDVTVDRVVDTLPAGFVYVLSSSTFASNSIGDPTTVGQVLDWSQTFTIPAGTSRDFVFRATPTLSGYGTNSGVAFIGNSQIDTTANTSDNAPGLETVRVLLEPRAVNDSTNTLENASLSVPAPGVLANDIEPNGFSLTVIGYSQPANGSVTVGADGSFSYVPATNFSGADSFTYTVTNGNLRASTATVNLFVGFVNHAPTLDPLNNVNLVENWNQFAVSLTGISAGAPSETNQVLTVTATSSNPSLIPNPSINYTSPNTTGSLTFSPVTDAFGTSVITVIVQDNGGTANGGVDAMTNTFTITEVGLTNYWYPGDSLTVNMSDATGTPGVGFTQTNYLGVLSVLATQTNPFTIKLDSFNGGVPGAAANFNNASNYTWTFATTTRGVIGLTTNQFIVDTSAFTNDLAGGTFTVVLAPDGSSVDLIFAPNSPPVADPVILTRSPGTSLKISITNLLSNFTSDPNGNGTIFLGLGPGTNGSYLATNSSLIFFAPTNNIPESFSYIIQDAANYRPGDTVYTATNWITVLLTNMFGYVQTITGITGTGVTVQFAGIPSYLYDVQRATNLSGPWLVLSTTNAPPNGLWTFTDDNPPIPSAFYRTAQH